ncbi:MAG: TonB-dependent receptor [Bacteroidia bacterium]
MQFLMLLLPVALSGQVSVHGSVTHKATGEPIPGAEIALLGPQQVVFTNQAGIFRFEDVAPGRQRIQVKAQDFLTYVQEIEVGKQDMQLGFRLIRSATVTDEVLITATRASERTATTYSQLDKAAIARRNFGQDLPILLDQVPGTVASSDAGAGVGYTGLRIRGTDATRTNVTINGVPLNDAESHGLFWVNLPDLASSAENIQVQRGVGTSTNGAGAFGASINIQTTALTYEPSVEAANSYGSFDTRKHTLQASTGLIEDRFAVDVRLSRIRSDGWVDRASSDLSSYFVSAGYYGKKSLVKLLHFAGREQTYQAWWGVPEALALGDAAGLEAHIARNGYTEAQIDNLRTAGRQYNYYTYDNEVDNYRQDHYQLHYSLQPNTRLYVNAALHYTAGRGYFEQYRADDDLAAYGLTAVVPGGDTLRNSDLIRRRWLDNDFYGLTYAASYQPVRRVQLTLGGAWNRYDGDHFGEIIWARWAGSSEIRDRYYESRGLKTDFNTYAKVNAEPLPGLLVYADMQVRKIGYTLGNPSLEGPGTDNDGQAIEGDFDYLFFNPKAGLTYLLSPRSHLYASWAVANREPVRSDFIDAPAGRTPLHETLYNWEAGYRLRQDRVSLSVNAYFMDYRNQLVLNGELNDVGAAVRQNVDASYRLGVEVAAQADPLPWLSLRGDVALSRNRIARFEEILYDYATGEVVTQVYEDTDIAFSPALVAGGGLDLRPLGSLLLSLNAKYVSDQYLDNTRNAARRLEAFLVGQLQASYSLYPVWAKELRIAVQVNNLFDAAYTPNGYTYSYLYAGEPTTENFLYPMAGRHYLLNLVWRL